MEINLFCLLHNIYYGDKMSDIDCKELSEKLDKVLININYVYNLMADIFVRLDNQGDMIYKMYNHKCIEVLDSEPRK